MSKYSITKSWFSIRNLYSFSLSLLNIIQHSRKKTILFAFWINSDGRNTKKKQISLKYTFIYVQLSLILISIRHLIIARQKMNDDDVILFCISFQRDFCFTFTDFDSVTQLVDAKWILILILDNILQRWFRKILIQIDDCHLHTWTLVRRLLLRELTFSSPLLLRQMFFFDWRRHINTAVTYILMVQMKKIEF